MRYETPAGGADSKLLVVSTFVRIQIKIAVNYVIS
jgi:hypothetical protein